MFRILRSLAVLAAVAGTGLAACDNSTGAAGDSTLRILLTDAPADYIAAAEVDIGAVELLGEGAPITLSDDGTEGMVNLLELQGAATASLANADIESGTYTQLRLIVESANVTLKDGYQFSDGSTTKSLFIPSGAQTGIKLNLGDAEGEDSGGLLIASGETVLVLDFDVNQSFVIQGDPESSAGINSVIFTPTLRVVAEDVAASISGSISTDLADVSVEGLTVTATPLDEGTLEAYQSQTATAVTDAAGAYTLFYLVPGSYVVTVAVGDGLQSDPASITVDVANSEDATGADFAVRTASTGS